MLIFRIAVLVVLFASLAAEAHGQCAGGSRALGRPVVRNAASRINQARPLRRLAGFAIRGLRCR